MGALLLLGGCSTDEFTWNGKEVDSDKVMITLHRADFDRSQAGTRSIDPSATIDNLTLVVFDDDQTNGEVINIEADQIESDVNNEIYAIYLPYNDIVGKGTRWRFFANAKSELANWAATTNRHEDSLKDIQFDQASQWGASNASTTKAVLYTPVQVIPEDQIQPGQVLNAGTSTPLKRIYGKIDFKINISDTQQSQYNLQVTGVGLLQKSPEKGDIIGSTATNPEEYQLSQINWLVPGTGNTYSVSLPGQSFSALEKNKVLTMRTYPLAEELTGNPHEQVLMIVKGRYQLGEKDEHGNVAQYTSSDVYYAVPVAGVAPNQYWTATITGVGSAGHPTINEALDNPSGLAVVFSDETADITSMVSDGENALAVGDTITIDAAGNQVLVNNMKQAFFSVRFRYSASETTPARDMLEYECVDENGKPAWLKINLQSVTEETGHGPEKLKWYTASFGVALDRNNGTDRECHYQFKIKGKESMKRDVLFLQQAPEGFNAASDAFKISLNISGAATSDNGTISDYGTFIKTASSSNGTTICDGIFPKLNGGRIRNEGLHIPMPNDESVVYTYTIKVNPAITGAYQLIKSANMPDDMVEISGSSTSGNLTADTQWTVKCQTPRNYDYTVYRDAIILKVGDSEYTLDLYHTGFFHKVSGRWGYYEVFTVPSTGAHWLDRNLGAKSAGMAVNNNNAYLSGAWPLSSGAEGAYLLQTQVSGQMPKGWGMPSYGNFEAIFTQQEFTVNAHNADDGTSYTAPSFSFLAKEYDRNKRGDETTIRAYFPGARYKQGTTLKGGNKSGYYLTTTQASGDYYQVAVFEGMNLISTTLNLVGVGMPVRPMIASGGSTGARIYECNVKGYTHVALYAYNKATQLKTWLTSWPGEQVVPYSASMVNNATGPLMVSKHFQKQVYFDYESNPDVELRVIFNICDQNGNVTHSNMVTETKKTTAPYVGTPDATELANHKKNREGIKFKHGATYSRENGLTGVADGAKNGNWSGGKKPTAKIVLTFPRLVKNSAIYEYVYLRNSSNPITYPGSGKVSNGLFKATESSGGYYSVTISVPYEEAQAPTITEAYLKGLIKSHKFYKSSNLTDANAYDGANAVSWTGNVGIKFDSFNASTKTLNVTIWNNSGVNPPAPMPKPEAVRGTIYYKGYNGRVPATDNGNVYISYSGGTNPVTKQLMTKVYINGELWYKYENVPLDNTALQVHSNQNNDYNQSNSDAKPNIKADYEATGSTELYYYLSSDNDWKLIRTTAGGGGGGGGGTKANLYLRGVVNGWNASSDYQFTTSDNKTFTLTVSNMTNGNFKIAGSDWNSDANFGSAGTNLSDGTYNLTHGTSSTDMSLSSGGNVTFTVVYNTANDHTKGAKVTITHN